MDDPLLDPRFPDRPQHPDFWRLSDVVLQQDGSMEEVADAADLEATFHKAFEGNVDFTSLDYMGKVRARQLLRSIGAVEDAPAIAAINAAWMSGVLAGISFEKKGGHREP